MTALLWLTRDLRVHDHPALCAALEEGGDVVPVFCFDSRLLNGRHASSTRARFMLECLAELDERLGGIAFRDGRPERVLPELAGELGASAVHATEDVGPFARRRAAAVRRALHCPLVLHPGVAAVDDLASIRTQAGGPYTVFSPFERTWLEEPRRRGARRSRPPPRASGAACAARFPHRRGDDPLSAAPPGGESAGRKRLEAS